jgi:hypothetical protein
MLFYWWNTGFFLYSSFICSKFLILAYMVYHKLQITVLRILMYSIMRRMYLIYFYSSDLNDIFKYRELKITIKLLLIFLQKIKSNPSVSHKYLSSAMVFEKNWLLSSWLCKIYWCKQKCMQGKFFMILFLSYIYTFQ